MWGQAWLKMKSSADSASDQPASAEASAPDVDPYSEIPGWSLNIHSMEPAEAMAEIVDHLKRLRAEVATLRAEVREKDETIVRYYQDR